MAKPARGLPSTFALELPEEQPVVIGDFLDEPPPVLAPTKRADQTIPAADFRSPRVRYEPAEETADLSWPRQIPVSERKPSRPKIIRYQLNLSPSSKRMFEELVEHIQTYSAEPDTRPSEIFQGIIGLLHGALDELDLAALPKRGAWGSVTARNFPGALSETFEKGILRSARRRGVSS